METRKRTRGTEQSAHPQAAGAKKQRSQPARGEPVAAPATAAAPTMKGAGSTKKKAPSKKKAAPAPASKQATATAGGGDSSDIVQINRAPVLTLWAAVVAQRQGYSWDEGLTFGRYISGVLAQSKGRSLGLFEEKEKSEEEIEGRKRRDEELGVERVEVFGMRCPAAPVGQEHHAVSGGEAIKPTTVTGYLKRSFGDRLPDVKAAMEVLAAAIPQDQIGRVCYKLYERIRPEWKGWGMKGALHLGEIRGLANSWREEV